MTRIDNIGKNSTLSKEDKVWLSGLSGALCADGFYTKSIYLDRLIINAKTSKET